MKLYRVFPFSPAARSLEPGGALFAPRSSAGRIANPELYSELYICTTAAGAVSEAFGRLDTWNPGTLSYHDRPYALAEFEFDDNAHICDLGNAGQLLSYNLAPSDVVARDRTVTQSWAVQIYSAKKWIGISWWSRYDSSWQSIGLWQRRGLRLRRAPEVLSVDHAAVREAASLLPRRLAS